VFACSAGSGGKLESLIGFASRILKLVVIVIGIGEENSRYGLRYLVSSDVEHDKCGDGDE